MKKQTTNHVSIFIVLSFLLLSKISFATDLDVVITITKYPRELMFLAMECKTERWSLSLLASSSIFFSMDKRSFPAYTKKITNLGPGDYVFTVIDGNNDMAFKSAKIYVM
ncbi:MAG: hypothetical protein IPG90_15845 [Bacteroidetes bacterium]|nr:hypothetical protein [Bacteroidota bacterium]